MNNYETGLLEAAAAHLRARGLTVTIKEPRRDEHSDAWLRVAKGKQHIDYAVDVQRQVTPQTLGAIVSQLNHRAALTKKPMLLVTNYITPPVADRLANLEQQFVDTAGNAFLDAPGVFVFITGRRPAKNAVAQRPDRAFTPAGLKTLFAFICNPQLVTATYREIAAAANIALGALPTVMTGIQQAGHLHVMGNKRQLVATRRLLDEWSLAYARTLRPKQLLRTLVSPAFEAWREWDLQADGARWGGEPAAALLTGNLKPGVLTLYADKLPARLMVQHRMMTARPNDDHNLVEVRRPFWGEVSSVRADVVPLPLVYADLLATGDARCLEVAEIIYEEYLARLFTST
ncbi:MAG TPA: type IV toxin-antitoxin system AbiEi family antitoxin [Steroidobacter sp.]|uniref:type IV toxin-antitoxin system AbiEi family antitoxin n=1 Tax=Steroidobacter sp. TaxID=1978227 RepID=UPI002EDA2CD5